MNAAPVPARGTGLFDEIASFRNLHRAARIAARGKRYRASAAQFLLAMESECLRLEEELQGGVWSPGPYRVFRITDPKPRTICAAPFRDRVVHQALVQVVEPLFERGFVYDSYSCRKGKGTLRALQRVARWVREYPWVLKVDVEKYFPSIDHMTVLGILSRRIRCERTLGLFGQILASWSSDEAPVRWFPGDNLLEPLRRRRGLPIGNLTSQFLSNVVLDVVDHAVKDRLGVRAYARYCDDLVVCGRSPGELWRTAGEIRAVLSTLRLVVHPKKTQVFAADQGVRWVGFRVFPFGVRVEADALRRARRRFRAFAGRAGTETAAASIQGWSGHAMRGLSPARLRRMLRLLPGVAAQGGRRSAPAERGGMGIRVPCGD